MCEMCSKGTGPCTCRVNCGSPDCKCPAAVPGGMSRDAWAAWNDIARRDSWDARFTRER